MTSSRRVVWWRESDAPDPYARLSGKLIYTPDIFVINLDVEGKMIGRIMKDIQFHPVSDRVLHVDFSAFEDKPVVMKAVARSLVTLLV